VTSRFEKLLYQIPQSHRPEESTLSTSILMDFRHIWFPFKQEESKDTSEAHGMAKEIEKNLYLTRANAMDILSLIETGIPMKTLLRKREGEQIIEQQNEDVDEEQELEQDDEVSACAPPADEALQESCFSCSKKRR
jgi:hypothetical protein